MRLTERMIKASLPDHPQQGELNDAEVRGLALRGNRRIASWSLRRTVNGKRQRIKLGEWPAVSAEAARRLARDAVEAWQAGSRGPLGGLGRLGAANRPNATLDGVLGAWAEAHGHLRQTEARKTALERGFKSLLAKDAGVLDTGDYLRVADRLSPGARTKALRDLRAVLRWAGERGLAPEGTLQNVRLPRGASREHVPTLAEVRAAYAFAAADDHAAAPLYQWLVLTAWRAGEGRSLQNDWINLQAGTVTVPAAFSKDKREHSHPLSSGMREVMGRGHADGLAFRREDGIEAHSHGTLSGFHGRVMAACQKANPEFRRFTIHDLRRAFATHLADAGADLMAIELSLGHSPSRMLGSVGAIYNRSQRWEQRVALYKMCKRRLRPTL